VEQLLAECLIHEHKKTANLHHFKAKQKQDSIDNKDLDIGWIKATFNNHGQSQEGIPLSTPLPPQKVPGTNGIVISFALNPDASRVLTFEQVLLLNTSLEAIRSLFNLTEHQGHLLFIAY